MFIYSLKKIYFILKFINSIHYTIISKIKYLRNKYLYFLFFSWGLGIGDWGLGIGDWGLGLLINKLCICSSLFNP